MAGGGVHKLGAKYIFLVIVAPSRCVFRDVCGVHVCVRDSVALLAVCVCGKRRRGCQEH